MRQGCQCKLQPPTCNDIGGVLLDTTYQAYYEDSKEKLLAEAPIFGIAVGGDGATIDKCPLFNAIACSASNPSMVLDVFDCSQHAAEGGKKDAEFILKTLLPKMIEIDPEKKLIDIVTFDSASIVQNTAKLLMFRFPTSTAPAVEHLVFDKVMRLRPISELCHTAKWVSCALFSLVIPEYSPLSCFPCRYGMCLEHKDMLHAPITSGYPK